MIVAVFHLRQNGYDVLGDEPMVRCVINKTPDVGKLRACYPGNPGQGAAGFRPLVGKPRMF